MENDRQKNQIGYIGKRIDVSKWTIEDINKYVLSMNKIISDELSKEKKEWFAIIHSKNWYIEKIDEKVYLCI